MEKIRIGVLMGGRSIEREVSFNSGRTVCDQIDVSLYKVVPLFQTETNELFKLPWRFLYRGKITDFVHRLAYEAEKIVWDDVPQHIDFMYIAQHGRYAEDGSLQGILEILGIPYLGSRVLGSALSMNKAMQKQFLALSGIKVPAYTIISSHTIETATYDIPWFPCVVKPVHEGSSLGVSVVADPSELYHAVKKAAYSDPREIQDVIIEEKIEGMEFSCIVITDTITGNLKPLPPTEIVPEKGSSFWDYEQKYMPGRSLKFTPARCADTMIAKIQSTCAHVMKALSMQHIARIDGVVTSRDEIVIIDPNSLIGMAPSSFFFKQAAEIGMNHTQIINHLIETGLMLYGKRMNTKIMPTRTVKKQKRLRIGVLFGGRSSEKEISLESGRNVLYKLSPSQYEAIPLFLNTKLELYHISDRLLVCNSTQEIESGLQNTPHITWHALSAYIDFAFIALHGGEGENGCVQGMLEMLNIPYNGSGILASALCIDKYQTNRFLKSLGMCTPHAHLINKKIFYTEKERLLIDVEKEISYPYIIKPHDDGCSVLVYKAHTREELISALHGIFDYGKEYALIEECIVGMELTVGVLGNEEDNCIVLPPSHAITNRDILSIEEKFLPGQGENHTPAPLSQSALKLVLESIKKTYQLLGCRGYARIDCFYQNAQENVSEKERVVILEVNTLPGLTPATCIFHQAAEIGYKPMEFINQIIQLGLQAYKNNKIVEYEISDKKQLEIISQ